MKLIIQVPCYNEERALPATLADLPRHVEGFDRVEWLVIDDGSSDRTAAVAREHGVDHVVVQPVNRGLAAGFMAGIEAALRAGADVIVNTDADNQYTAADIPALCGPILDGRADMVIGARPINDIEHFSPVKKALQRLGSRVVRLVSNTDVADAPSGFRALSRDAAMKLNVFNRYTYTLETIIQAGQKGIHVVNVPIRTNGPTRPSRLVKSIGSYVRRSISTIFRIFVLYRPALFCFWLGIVPLLAGLGLYVRWLVLYFAEEVYRSRIPSLTLGAVLILAAVLIWMFGFLADLLAANRRLIEDCQVRLRRLDLRSAELRTRRDDEAGSTTGPS